MSLFVRCNNILANACKIDTIGTICRAGTFAILLTMTHTSSPILNMTLIISPFNISCNINHNVASSVKNLFEHDRKIYDRKLRERSLGKHSHLRYSNFPHCPFLHKHTLLSTRFFTPFWVMSGELAETDQRWMHRDQRACTEVIKIRNEACRQPHCSLSQLTLEVGYACDLCRKGKVSDQIFMI